MFFVKETYFVYTLVSAKYNKTLALCQRNLCDLSLPIKLVLYHETLTKCCVLHTNKALNSVA